METTLVDFVKVLRTAEIQVSPAETLDAMEALELVGYRNRTLLKNSLSMILSKTPEEKELFETSFEKFFTFEKFVRNTSIATSTMIVKRSIIDNIKFSNTKICEDYFFKCQILKKAKSAYCFPKIMTKYRIGSESLQSNKFRNLFWIWNINKKYTLEVNRDGDIFFPDIGPVYVAGLTFKDLKETLQKIISNQLIGTEISLTLGSLKSINILFEMLQL